MTYKDSDKQREYQRLWIRAKNGDEKAKQEIKKFKRILLTDEEKKKRKQQRLDDLREKRKEKHANNVKSCKLHTKRIGRIAELRFASELLKLGYDVYTPETEELPIDMIIIKDGIIQKVQIKSVTPVDDVLKVPMKSSTIKYRKLYRDTDVDIMAVFDSVNEKGYFVPINNNKTAFALRLIPPKIKNETVHMAKDYEIF